MIGQFWDLLEIVTGPLKKRRNTVVDIYPCVEFKKVDAERCINDFIPTLSDDIGPQVGSASGEVTCRQDLLH